MKVFSGRSNQTLAIKIAKCLEIDLGKIEIGEYANGEIKMRVGEKSLGKRAIVVQSLVAPVEKNLIEMLFIADSLKRNGVEKIVGVIPYLGYSKQDKVFLKGEALSAEVIARVLQTAGWEKLIFVNLHNEEILKFFSCPVKHLSSKSLFRDNFKNLKEAVVLAPDEGAEKSVRDLAKKLNLEAVYLNKVRNLKTGKVKIVGIKGEVKGKTVLIKDDMIVTGSTLLETVKYLKLRGANKILVAATHHLYVKGAQELLEKSQIERLVVTDTIKLEKPFKKLKVLSLAKTIAEAIDN